MSLGAAGEFNALTQEWTDGIASTMIRQAVSLTGDSDDYQWVVFDGPVDALWIENMNTVLDDNSTLVPFAQQTNGP